MDKSILSSNKISKNQSNSNSETASQYRGVQNVVPSIDNTPNAKSEAQVVKENDIFLFIVVHTYDENSFIITSTVQNVFEAIAIKKDNNPNSFTLGQTYSDGRESKYNIKTQNYIGSEQLAQSKIEKNGSFKIKSQ